ncbi:amidohydrolase family protein [Nocardioides sp. GCM10030258]|uniref:amidohydrolase family protein n=1 Tax=unclassified Nocardioides TaxID=2615069 RepID=UPI0036179956
MSNSSSKRLLLRGGHVVSQDPSIGDVPNGDVLIEGQTIVAVGNDLDATDAEVVDASRYAVLPGLVDTHRHTWQTAMRGAVEPGNYFATVLVKLGPLYRPEDVYIGNLLGAVSALESGITTMLDWSHIMNSPAHADAAVQGLANAGIRGIFAHGVGQNGASAGVSGSNSQQHSDDIRRVQKDFFSTDNQLLTLALAFGGPEFSSIEDTKVDVELARDMGIRLTTHVGVLPGKAAVTQMRDAGLLGDDITYIHTALCSDDEIKMIGDSGGSVSSSPLNENLLGLTRWVRNGVRPSISLDTETIAPTDLFTQMRALLWNEWVAQRGVEDKEPFAVRDMLEFATIEGAKATGLDHKIGTLTPGKRADIIMVNLEDISTMPRAEDPVNTVLMQAGPHNVAWVIVDGEVRKRDGKLVGIDKDRILELATSSHAFLAKEAGFTA